jgi:glycosyltransferase involved in cell wall biosynthesis
VNVGEFSGACIKFLYYTVVSGEVSVAQVGVASYFSMRVMHILDSLNRGGAEMLALDVCRNARKLDLDLTFVATGGGDLEADFRGSGAVFHRLQRRLPVDLRLAMRLGRIIKDRDIEVVHTHQAVESLHAYLATRGSDVKRVMTFHLCTADTKNRVALRFVTPRLHAGVAVSNSLLKCLGDAGLDTDDKFHVIPNGVDVARLGQADRSLRSELGLSESEPLLGMIGNFYADGRKDQRTICLALPKFFQSVSNAHFVFAGGAFKDSTGLLEECLNICRQHNIQGRVHFLGKRSDIANILHSLDVYVHSSVNESQGIAVVEAMLAGLPVIVSDIGALMEVTNNGDCALVFRTGDAEHLADQLLKLAQDKALQASLAGKGKTYATHCFSIDAHIKNLLTLYQNISRS